jgi:spermidine synthase
MRRLTFLLFFVSGVLALLYEVIWLRLLVLVLGSTQSAVTAVLVAFMGGLALGALLAGRLADSSRTHPLILYAALECGIGLSALGVPSMLNWFAPAHIVPSSLNASLVLLVPTTLMGATLPILTRFVTRHPDEIGVSVGSLYAVNTAGAVIGTLLTGFALIPGFGVSRSIHLAASANLALGTLAFVAAMLTRAQRVAVSIPAVRKTVRGRRANVPITTRSRAALYAIAASGLLALVYEIVWTRVLVLILGSSVYAFTAMLATFLVGIAVGAALGSRIADRRSRDRQLRSLAMTVAAAALAGYLTLLIFPLLPSLFARTFNDWGLAPGAEANTVWRAVSLLTVEFLFTFLVMFPATVFMGIAFPLAVRLWAEGLEDIGRSVGTVYAANTAGSIAGAVLGGFVLVPRLGLQGSLIAATSGGLIVAAALAIFSRRSKRPATGLVLVVPMLALMIWMRPAWDPLVMNSGIYQYAPDLRDVLLTTREFAALTHEDVDVLYYEEGLTANVVVGRRHSTGNVWLAVNGKIDASSKTDLETQLLLAHVPMLLARSAEQGARVAVIGYATGITTGAVTRHKPSHVDAVEIESAVLRASSFFDAFNYKPLSDARVRAIVADGRSYLRGQASPYDVIISEPSSPWMTMAANLFTREYFETGRARLAPGGVFCQWIQLYGLPLDDLRSLVGTFTAVFPSVAVFWGIPGQDLIVVGAEAPIAVDLERVRLALSDPEIAADADRIGIQRVEDLLAYYLMDDPTARRFAGDARLNTDDNALIEFRAPLTMHNWAATQASNARTLRALSVDPFAQARGLAGDKEPRASAYATLAEALHRRRMFEQAVSAQRRAHELLPTDARAARLAEFEAAATSAIP